MWNGMKFVYKLHYDVITYKNVNIVILDYGKILREWFQNEDETIRYYRWNGYRNNWYMNSNNLYSRSL